jgi:hypothetical protein
MNAFGHHFFCQTPPPKSQVLGQAQQDRQKFDKDQEWLR